MVSITEAKVREIHRAMPDGLSKYSCEELKAADTYVKNFAMRKLAEKLPAEWPAEARHWFLLQASLSYGAVETDNMLIAFKCYPEWN